MAPTEAALGEALATVHDPEFNRSIVELGMLRGLSVVGDRAQVLVAMATADHPGRPSIQSAIERAAEDAGFAGVEVEFTEMSEDEQSALRSQLIGNPAESAGSQQGHGHAEGRAVSFAEPGSTTRVLLIASGKGGVGKSTTAVNLALALKALGAQVGRTEDVDRHVDVRFGRVVDASARRVAVADRWRRAGADQLTARSHRFDTRRRLRRRRSRPVRACR